MSVSRPQVARADVTGATLTGLAAGTLFVNFSDKKLLIQGPSGLIDIIPIRYFSPDADYEAGVLVVNGSDILVSLSAVSAGPFNAVEWSSVISSPFSGILGSLNWSFSLIKNVAGLVETITLVKGDLRVLQTYYYNTTSLVDYITYESSTNAGVDYTPLGTETMQYDTNNEITGSIWS